MSREIKLLTKSANHLLRFLVLKEHRNCIIYSEVQGSVQISADTDKIKVNSVSVHILFRTPSDDKTF